MKKIIMVLCVLLLASCATVPEKTINDYSISIQSDMPNSGIVVAVPLIHWERYLFDPGLSGFTVEISNNTQSIARVAWEKSSINYAGGSSGIFLDGMRYIDAGKAPTPTVIPPGGRVAKGVFSSTQPAFTGEAWRMRPLILPVQIMLCVESAGKEIYFTITVKDKAY